MGNQAPLGQQEFHAEVAKIHSRLDRLNSRLHSLGEDRISKLENEVSDLKRLLERCLNSINPSGNGGIENSGTVRSSHSTHLPGVKERFE